MSRLCNQRGFAWTKLLSLGSGLRWSTWKHQPVKKFINLFNKIIRTGVGIARSVWLQKKERKRNHDEEKDVVFLSFLLQCLFKSSKHPIHRNRFVGNRQHFLTDHRAVFDRRPVAYNHRLYEKSFHVWIRRIYLNFDWNTIACLNHRHLRHEFVRLVEEEYRKYVEVESRWEVNLDRLLMIECTY